MANNLLKNFCFDIKRTVIDEIALEGLEGISFDALWKRLEHRISSFVTEKLKERVWKIIVDNPCISLYQLPEPVPRMDFLDRFQIIDPETGNIKDPDFCLDGPYEFCPVPLDQGSCKDYATRKLIPSSQLKGVVLEKVVAEYGDTLVMVASIQERWNSLTGHVPITNLQLLTPTQYCLLELVGKARENGQMTTGTTNLTKIVKEPKNMFYNRKCLIDLNLIRMNYVTLVCGNRGIKSILLRINRFHKPNALTQPKHGKLFDLVEYLKNQPGYIEKTDTMWKNGLLTQNQAKRLKKTVNIFDFEEKTVKLDELPKTNKNRYNSTASMFRKRKFICLSANSDESSQSDEEVTEPIECQYKLGIGLMRQAYEMFLEAGLKGLTQLELAQLIGVQFYTSRSICRIFKSSKIIREFFEDRGKQRVSKFVAIAAGLSDAKYAQEKLTFLENIKDKPEPIEDDNKPSTSQQESEEQSATVENTQEAIEHITEIKVLDGAVHANNKPLVESNNLTLRQLKFANGLLKIIKERQCVTGYQTLSNLIAKEINETPMVTKALKSFMQRFLSEGRLKVYKVRWPGLGNEHNALNVICAPHIKATDAIVRAKYKEVYLRAMEKKRIIKKDSTDSPCRSISTLINPRYMKIQILHECIIKLVYFEPISDSIYSQKGFLTVTEMLPEITVKFAISNMSLSGMSEISHLRISENQLNMKLRDAPTEISHYIIKSKSLRNALRMNLKILAMHGLIQLIYQPSMQSLDYSNNFLSSFLFYVNRNAKIINTTGTWPRENADIKSLERSYHFEKFEDVKTFWGDVYEVSVGSRILTKNRMKKKIHPPVRREEEVAIHDNGERYGDGNGPCGFDSCFFMELPRLWHTFYIRKTPLKKKAPMKIPHLKIPKVAKHKIPTPKQVKKKKKVPKISPVMKVKVTDKSKKKIGDLTVTWTKDEDLMIMMCMAAITIASPSSQPGSLRVRNLVAKDILSKHDPKKNQTTCHRRALALQLNPTITHEKDSLLNEVRRRRYLISKYEGLIKKLRLRFSTNISKFINEARLPLLELVWLLWRVYLSESYSRRLPCVAFSIEDFHATYTIIPSTSNKLYNLYKAPELVLLRESVFLTIMMSHNYDVKPDLAKRIYGIFKIYPENSLRIVVDQLRRCGAVSAKEKLFNNQMHRLHLEDIVQSSYKISAKYQQRWISRLNSEFVVTLARVINEGLPQNMIKGSAEINCLLCELQASDMMTLESSTKPVIVDTSDSTNPDQLNVIDIETKFKLKSGSVMWKANSDKDYESLKNICQIYNNKEYKHILEKLSRECVVNAEDGLKFSLEDPIIKYLHNKGEEGSTFDDLKNVTGYSTKRLINRLQDLETEKVVKRVGYNNNLLILTKFIAPWALKVENKHVIITPWLNMDFKIRYEILLEWAGVIMNKIFEYPGSSIHYISDSFDYITSRAVQDVCLFLQTSKCISLQTLTGDTPDLFSDDLRMPELSEFNIYASPENIVAFPYKDSLLRYASLRKTMLDEVKPVDKVSNITNKVT